MYHINGYKVASKHPIPKELKVGIIEAANTIVYRAQCANIRCNRSDVIIFYDETSTYWYILGNPVLHTMEFLDDAGKYQEVQVYNINLALAPPKHIIDIEVKREAEHQTYKATWLLPRLQILIPELCIRIKHEPS